MKTQILTQSELAELQYMRERLKKIFKVSRKKTTKDSRFLVPEPNLTQDERNIENEIRLLDKIISSL